MEKKIIDRTRGAHIPLVQNDDFHDGRDFIEVRSVKRETAKQQLHGIMTPEEIEQFLAQIASDPDGCSYTVQCGVPE